MAIDGYVVVPVMSAAELREILGYAVWHVSEATVPVPDAEGLLNRVRARMAAMDPVDGDQVYLAARAEL